MKTADEAEWQRQRQELLADEDEIAKIFHDFMVAWAETAEQIMNDYPDRNPMQALREGLLPTQQAHPLPETILPSLFVGQMLACLGAHWHYGHQAISETNQIELILVADCVGLKMAQLQQTAQAESNPVS